MKKILITGAGGFIGREILPKIDRAKYIIHAISREKKFDVENIITHNIDLFDLEKVKSLFEEIQPEYLLHLAWITDPKDYRISIENKEWLKSGLAMVKHFKDNGGEKLIVAGSCAENEKTDFEKNLYGVCKNSFKTMISHILKNSEIKFSWGKIYNAYGLNENKQRFIPSVIQTLKNNQDFTCLSPEKKSDFINVKDIASAFITLLENDISGEFDIGTGKYTSLREIVLYISKEMNKENLIFFKEGIPEDFQKIKFNFIPGWKPEIDIFTGLKEMIK